MEASKGWNKVWWVLFTSQARELPNSTAIVDPDFDDDAYAEPITAESLDYMRQTGR